MDKQEIMDLEGRELDGRVYVERHGAQASGMVVSDKAYPHYSTDIFAAMGLVRSLEGYGGMKSFQLKYWARDGWSASFVPGPVLIGDWVSAEDPAEAICKAYLLWKESQDE